MLAFLIGIFSATSVRSARGAQLGGLDNCEAFYRLAKAHLAWFDTSGNDGYYVYDPQRSIAYSNLYTACVVRNGAIH